MAGDAVDVEGLHIDVLSVAGRRVRKVRISRVEHTPVEAEGG